MNDEYKIENLIKIIVILLLIVGVFYGLTIIVMNNQKEDLNNNIESDTEIKYDHILIGNIYNQKEQEYYVLVELDSDYLTLNSIVSNYSKKENALKIYTSSLNNVFNKKTKLLWQQKK